jgi:uncharacterized protein (TIGR02145 family)
LDVTTYRDGTPIPQVTDLATWATLTTGAWCYYNNDPANGAIYGKLYNWFAVNDSRGLGPLGYHLPTDAEWTTLITELGGPAEAGGKMKEAGLCHWQFPNIAATNSSGFTGRPAGYRDNNGSFFTINLLAHWWSSTAFDTIDAWYRYLNYSTGNALISKNNKRFGFSIRLIKN